MEKFCFWKRIGIHWSWSVHVCMIAFLKTSFSIGQTITYAAPISGVMLTNDFELGLSNYTINSTAVADGGTGYSAVPAGSLGYIVFSPGTDLSTLTSCTITINGSTYPVSYSLFSLDVLEITMPVSLPAQTDFIFFAQNVTNPPINPACGTAANVYSSSAPCDGGIQIFLENTYPTPGATTVYHHYGTPLYTIVPQTYFVQSVTQRKLNKSNALINSDDQEVVMIDMFVAGNNGSLPTLTGLSLGSASSSNMSALTDANLYASSADFFHSNNDILLVNTDLSSGFFSTNALNFPLIPGHNYFFLAYDLTCDFALLGEIIDGELIEARFNGGPSILPANNPIGNRTISLDYSLINTGSNLVPNGGFEQYSICPASWFTLTSSFSTHGVVGWESPTFGQSGIWNGTSDYFNACAPAATVGVPANMDGWQQAHGGTAYAGFGHWGDWNSEYIQCQLSAPLVAGNTYALNFFVSLTETSGGARNGVGAYLSSGQTVPTVNSLLPLSPVVVESSIVNDRVDWYPVSGVFTASGGEQWILIGNFIGDAVANMLGSNSSFYYIDDVSLVDISDVLTPCLFLATDLISFDAEAVEYDQVDLIWSVQAEQGVDHFELRRQISGAWETIATIASIGDHQGMHTYRYLDRPSAELAYYALFEVQMDGQKKNLAQTYVEFERSVLVAPNPFEFDFEVDLSAFKRNVLIQLIDLNGVRVWEEACLGGSHKKIAPEIPNGFYILRVEDEDGKIIRERILKNTMP